MPEARIAPPQIRELRELVRYRAKIVAIRSGLKAQVHAVLAKAGVFIAASDLFGVEARKRLEKTPLAGPYAQRVGSLLLRSVSTGTAGKRHGCRSNANHVLLKGDRILIVKMERDHFHYCVDCARKFIATTREKLTTLGPNSSRRLTRWGPTARTSADAALLLDRDQQRDRARPPSEPRSLEH